MGSRPKKSPRQKDITSAYSAGSFDEDTVDSQQRFGSRQKHAQQRKIERTALLRETEQAVPDLETLPIGRVVQVFSLYAEVSYQGTTRLCVVRKTLRKVAGASSIVVGDRVRFRDVPGHESVIEQILARKTLLTRVASFRSGQEQPIVANAEQMLIVTSIAEPRPKWGLVDRMIVAGKWGGLRPVVCLNKIDLGESDEAEAVLRHYASLGIAGLKVSARTDGHLAELMQHLKGRTTVLAGQSGVGKSSLIGRIQPGLDIRVGAVSVQTEKGRHTTTGARIYCLEMGGEVIDTPGVKVFGLWGMRRSQLEEYYPDVADSTAPAWRRASYLRLAESLPE